MKEFLDDALEELKRVDHMIYVSLKYTRTVDVLKNIIERLINAYGFAIDGLLHKAKKKKKITDIPPSPKLRCELLMETYPEDKVLHDHLNFYLLLKRLSKANYKRQSEYRRHVTMIAMLQSGETMNVDIDIINEYYEKTKEFIEYVKDW